MNVKIVVDSTADVNAAVRDRLAVVPLTIHFGDVEYVDGVTIDHKTFYEKLIESDVLPTTSQAAPDAFAQVFKRETQDGSQLVVLTVASGLSGTYQSAMIAAQDYPGQVYVVDSCSIAIGTGILAEYALQLSDRGMSAEEIVHCLEKERENIRVVAMLDTLEYLQRGGRISKTVAFAGGLLGIKPVVSLRGGEIEILGKARGSKQGNNQLVREIQTAGGVNFEKPLLLGYTGLSDHLLKKYIADSAFLWQDQVAELPVSVIGSVVGTHAGPGAIAVAFFKKDA